MLTAAGIDKAFIDSFREQARDLDSIVKRNAEARRRHAQESAGIVKELKAGLPTLSVIDGLIALHAPRLQTSWQFQRGVRKKVERPRKIRRRRPRPDGGAVQ